MLLQVAKKLPTRQRHRALTTLLQIPQCVLVGMQICFANTPAASVCTVKFSDLHEDCDKHKFESCAVCSGECSDRQASVPYCKRHVKKVLAVCGDCGVVACDTLVQESQACEGRICTDCLKNGQCKRCNYEWQNVL